MSMYENSCILYYTLITQFRQENKMQIYSLIDGQKLYI